MASTGRRSITHPVMNPDIISIRLGDNRFKESTKPLPYVYNANERVETKFDVVTYSQNDDGATFLRREEFLAVACECELKFPSGTTGGLRPLFGTVMTIPRANLSPSPME